MIKRPLTKLPLPKPLSGSENGSFAYYTITVRMPRIVLEVLEENDYSREIQGKLRTLLDEIPHGRLRPLQDTSAPDAGDWADYFPPYAGKNWLEVPWFFAEGYFYRRLLEATGYFEDGPFHGVDPYSSSKRKLLESASPVIRYLSRVIAHSLQAPELDVKQKQHRLHKLMVMNVWGNQADLSMWSAHEARPDHQEADDQAAHMLIDDALSVFEILFNPGQRAEQVDFILDNYGPELVHDIGLADYLLSTEVVKRVRFHLRAHPAFVSDALIPDIYQAVEYLVNFPEPHAQDLGKRAKRHLNSDRLQLTQDFFWNSPLSFWEMPDRVRQALSQADLVISKGDYNYRRLVGDRTWPTTTPFEEVVCYLPTPLVSLRVLKAEVVLGLPPGKAEALDQEDPEWLFNGRWGVIQFTR